MEVRTEQKAGASGPRRRQVEAPARPVTPLAVSIGLPAVQGTPREWVLHEAVQKLVRGARERTQRIAGCCASYVDYALEVLARGAEVTPGDLALGMGIASDHSVRRVRIALQSLVEVGLAAAVHPGVYRLHVDNVQKAVALSEARAARHPRR